MTLEQLLAAAEAQLRSLLDDRAARTQSLAEMRDAAEAPPLSDVDAAIAARDALDPQIDAARARVDELRAEADRDAAAAELARTLGDAPAARGTASVSVASEPDTYRRDGEHSYFRDLYQAQKLGRADAYERLDRDRAARAVGTADGGIGEFVPPAWLIDEFEPLARAGRVTADLLRQEALPPGTDSISLPVVTGGTSVAEQTTQGNALSETDMTSSSATAAVATEGGVATSNLQLLEQSPIQIDTVIFQDLANAHAVAVDTFTLANNATGKKGLLSVTGINAVTYTDASPTVPELWPKLIDAKRQIHKGRFLPATHVIMHPDRWAWFEAQLDANGRPYVSDGLSTALPLLGISDANVPEGYAGTIRGISLPVHLDANVPVNLGTGTNEDRIIFLRASDSTLYSSAPRAEVFRETKSKEAQVVFRLYSYLALMSARAPKSISVISGTGLAAPTF
jgi:HK97 family phage major capsid protein